MIGSISTVADQMGSRLSWSGRCTRASLVGASPPFPTPFLDTSASMVFAFEGAAHGVVRPTPTPRRDGTPGFGNFVRARAPKSGP